MLRDRKMQGIMLAVLAGLIFGTAGILTRSIYGISSIGIAAARLALAFLFMNCLIRQQRSWPELKRSVQQYPLLLVLGVLSSFHFVFFAIAVQKTFIANALILVNTAPILVLFLAPIFLREAMSRSDGLSVAITSMGAGLIVGFDRLTLSREHVVGDLCALGSALCYALYIILARRLRQRYSSPVIMFWFFGLGAIFLMLGGLVLQDQMLSAPSARSLFFLLLLGLLPTSIGHFCYNLSLKYIPAAKASTIILLEPVTGSLLALLLLDEVPPLSSFLGILLVFIGIGVASVSHLKGAL
ncbi:MAG: DMT family transporter [bacterium]|nr:DMT family transporter [bacterium]